MILYICSNQSIWEVKMKNENLSEKVSVNINSSTLSEIDLLVDNGYYSNRSDFINHALRSALREERSTINRIIESNIKSSRSGNNWFIGIYGLTAKEIEEMHAKGEKLSLTGYGILTIDTNCDEEKLFRVVESIKHRGKIKCSPTVKAHYGIK